jgi:hypothetical protein
VLNDTELTPLLETQTLQSALSTLQTRPNSSIRVSVLVTDGDVSTLIPVTLAHAELESMDLDDAGRLIESYAVLRFGSMPETSRVVAA